MPETQSATITSLIYASDAEQRHQIVQTVEASESVSCIDETYELDYFRERLSVHRYDLVVLVLDDIEERLPACLLRYPDLQVLAVTPARKIGTLQTWLDQGANDIVCYHQQERVVFAVKRMLDECVVKAQLRALSYQLASQHKLQQILLDTRVEGVMLWQHGQILESNTCFNSLIACKADDKLARGIQWKRWLSAQSYGDLHTTDVPTAGEMVISNTFGQQYQARIECLILERGTAQLIRINPHPASGAKTDHSAMDSVTGLLQRDHFIHQFSTWLHHTTLARYTVVQITLEDPGKRADSSHSNTTLQELMVYRVANRIQQRFSTQALLGRTAPTALTLVSKRADAQSRSLAKQVRLCLGNAGGLLESSDSIRVKTLTLSPNALAAEAVLARLEVSARQSDRHPKPQRPLQSISA